MRDEQIKAIWKRHMGQYNLSAGELAALREVAEKSADAARHQVGEALKEAPTGLDVKAFGEQLSKLSGGELVNIGLLALAEEIASEKT